MTDLLWEFQNVEGSLQLLDTVVCLASERQSCERSRRSRPFPQQLEACTELAAAASAVAASAVAASAAVASAAAAPASFQASKR